MNVHALRNVSRLYRTEYCALPHYLVWKYEAIQMLMGLYAALKTLTALLVDSPHAPGPSP